MSLRWQLPAGLLDSGSASAATFLVGLYAVRELDADALGVYALFFTAFLLAPTVVTNLIFTPANVVALTVPPPQRLRLYRQAFAAGLATALIAAATVLVAILPARSAVDAFTLWALALTALAASILAPLQNYMRSLFYLGEKPWYSVMVSGSLLVVVAAVLVGASLLGVAPEYLPFGALVVGNAVALLIAVGLAERGGQDAPPNLMRWRDLARPGRWLLGVDLLPTASGFVASTLVLTLGGPDILGLAEAARVAARPLMVTVIGIAAVINPKAMEAGRDGNREQGERLNRVADLLVLGLGVLYLLAAGFSWPGNLMERIIPKAYEVPGLTAAAILAAATAGALFAERAQLIGGGREVSLAKIEFVGSVFVLLGALTVDVTMAFALSVGFISRAVVRWIGYRRALTKHYRAARVQGRLMSLRHELPME
jgi:O-antigen/teichoic acid export membrane protein